jgi:hypothetical protein
MNIHVQSTYTQVNGQIRILHHWANRPDSERIAHEHGGRLANLQEILIAFKKDPDSLRKVERRWFWLGGDLDSKLKGPCRIDYERGELVQITENDWHKLPPEQRARVCGGNGPLALSVGYGDESGYLGINSNFESGLTSPWVAVVPHRSDLPLRTHGTGGGSIQMIRGEGAVRKIEPRRV